MGGWLLYNKIILGFLTKVSAFLKYRGIGIGHKLSIGIGIGLNFGIGTSLLVSSKQHNFRETEIYIYIYICLYITIGDSHAVFYMPVEFCTIGSKIPFY